MVQDNPQFKKRLLTVVFNVSHLVSVHYFEFAKDFIFEGENHDFWEFLYVDKGEVEVMAGTTGYKLKQGDIIFHEPNEFHSVWANRKVAPNVIVISFTCQSPSMSKFRKSLFFLQDYERNLLAECIKYAKLTFRPPFGDYERHDLIPLEDIPLGSEQMLKIYLELLLLSLASRQHSLPISNRLSTKAKERSEDEIVKRTFKYLQDHLQEDVSLEDICRHLNISQTHLITLFKEKVGMGVIRHFKTEKIEYAKRLIRERDMNFTEISEHLGYSSIHTFSRHFKKLTDMTPTEYAKSTQARA